jgi:hypothetical protein
MITLSTLIPTIYLKYEALKIFDMFRNLSFQYDMALCLEIKVSSTALVINVKTYTSHL